MALNLIRGRALPDAVFSPVQLRMGIRVEAEEHGVSKEDAKRVAKDHLLEDPKYYTHLKRMEKQVRASGRTGQKK